MARSAEVEQKQVSKKYILSCQIFIDCCWVFFQYVLKKEIQNVTTYLS